MVSFSLVGLREPVLEDLVGGEFSVTSQEGLLKFGHLYVDFHRLDLNFM